ncbi:MAG: mechanosensitive ion channel family protein [Syntrophomonadaceae bacterium]|nr:mechanosensitive ion channel family protein [Syntrophomonadaceae bacterium]
MFDKTLDVVYDINIYDLVNNVNIKAAFVAVIIFLLFLLMRKVFTGYIFRWILAHVSRSNAVLAEKILLSFEKPVRIFFIILGFYFALRYLPLGDLHDEMVSKLFRSAVIVLITWGLYDLCGSHSVLSEEIREKLKIDNILIPFFSKVLRFIVIALGIVVIAQEWDYNVSGFVAGLGLGGLAFALAAKDAIANIFGGIVIVIEKPFLIGDWIATPNIEGVVEDITFRSTKVRAFDQSLITVPNSTLASDIITNYSRMGKRRITFNLGVTYDTPVDKLKKCVEEIKQMLLNHPGIHPETVFVFFNTFGDSSLDIFLYFFTNTTIWKEYLAVREDVNFEIMKILEREGISVAFPSRSIYFENPDVIKRIIPDNGAETPAHQVAPKE